jgi:hypothetical protein
VLDLLIYLKEKSLKESLVYAAGLKLLIKQITVELDSSKPEVKRIFEFLIKDEVNEIIKDDGEYS